LSAARTLRLGTRGSRLALWQAHTVADRLTAAGIAAEIVIIKTSGDKSQSEPAAQPGPQDVHKREFVKELEDALLADAVDVAVHSAKDMPVDLPDGLALAACLPREDPRDALVLPSGNEAGAFDEVCRRLRSGAVVGTGSVRRMAQLARLPVTFAPIRGNVDTRLQKLDSGQFEALILACAGLRRLGSGHRVTAAIPIEECVPAPGQGIVATEIRANDGEAERALRSIHDPDAGTALIAERALVSALGGGCQLPLGGIARRPGRDDALEMVAVVASLDGARVIRGTMRGTVQQPEDLGRRLAAELIGSGAKDILDAIR
jgi:hydroxymethylbilane synthase